MFHGTIVRGRKGPACFWEKEWGSIDSAKYDAYILSQLQPFFAANPSFLYMQDNAPSHRSRLTTRNLQRRGIPTIKWPPYSPDLNLIEHVWNWMKNWIQNHYWEARYNISSVPLDHLRQIIWDAWQAVPDDYIEALLNSWWARCQAVIDACGGPTKY
jgi:transposase